MWLWQYVIHWSIWGSWCDNPGCHAAKPPHGLLIFTRNWQVEDALVGNILEEVLQAVDVAGEIAIDVGLVLLSMPTQLSPKTLFLIQFCLQLSSFETVMIVIVSWPCSTSTQRSELRTGPNCRWKLETCKTGGFPLSQNNHWWSENTIMALWTSKAGWHHGLHGFLENLQGWTPSIEPLAFTSVWEKLGCGSLMFSVTAGICVPGIHVIGWTCPRVRPPRSCSLRSRNCRFGWQSDAFQDAKCSRCLSDNHLAHPIVSPLSYVSNAK